MLVLVMFAVANNDTLVATLYQSSSCGNARTVALHFKCDQYIQIGYLTKIFFFPMNFYTVFVIFHGFVIFSFCFHIFSN